jgi:hypothetical protein
LYSLGVILFQLLTGRLPFQFQSSRDLREQIIHRDVRPPRSIDDTIPPELDRICLKCLAKDVNKRYSTGLDLANDLDHWNSTPRTFSPQKILLAAGLMLSVVAVVVHFGFNTRPKEASNTAVVPTPTLNAKPASDSWRELLDRPLEKVAFVKADSTDGWELDSAKRTLVLRSERNWMILATQENGAPPFRIRSQVHLKDWIGNIGLVWGITDDLVALPKKQRQCVAVVIQRTQPTGPARLCLQRMIVGEMLLDVQWVNSVTEIDRTELEIADRGVHALELEIRESGIEVFWDGESIWKPTIHDPNQTAAILRADGTIGVVGHGKSAVFRDVAVKFLAPAPRKDN